MDTPTARTHQAARMGQVLLFALGALAVRVFVAAATEVASAPVLGTSVLALAVCAVAWGGAYLFGKIRRV